MKFTNIFIAASFVCLLVSFWNRNNLPANTDYVPAIMNEPAQTATNKLPFEVTFNGVQYRVEPEFAYDIVGMIISTCSTT